LFVNMPRRYPVTFWYALKYFHNQIGVFTGRGAFGHAQHPEDNAGSGAVKKITGLRRRSTV